MADALTKQGGGLNESVVQTLMPEHIYMSIHETARTSSMIFLCLSFFCKCSRFMDNNKISLTAVCRQKCTCSVCQEELAGGSWDKEGTCSVLLPTPKGWDRLRSGCS